MKREQELEDAGLLVLDGGKFISEHEAVWDDLEDVEFCQDLVSKFARKSAKTTRNGNGEIVGYETIVTEFLAARYLHTDGKPYSLATVLRGKYESDTALKEFLPEFANWIRNYVLDCIHEHRFAFTPRYSQIVPTHTWSLCRHSVRRELLTALAEEYVRDREGLLRFVCAVFKRWRKINAPDSLSRVRLITQQHLGGPKVVAQYLQNIGAVSKCTTAKHSESLRGRIKKYRGRDRKKALKRCQKAR